MAEIIQEITLDVSKENTYEVVLAKQGDYASRNIKATIVNRTSKIDCSGAKLVTLNMVRVDGEAKLFEGDANEDGTVTLPLTTWMLKVPGTSRCSVSIVDNDARLSTMSFYLVVQYAEFSEDDILDNDEGDLLLRLLNAAENEADRVENEAQRVINENTRQVNEAQRIANENARIDAERQRSDAETKRASDTAKALAESESATTNANNAAQQAASALLGGGYIPIYDEDDNKNYNYQLVIRNGHPVLTAVEVEATE